MIVLATAPCVGTFCATDMSTVATEMKEAYGDYVVALDPRREVEMTKEDFAEFLGALRCCWSVQTSIRWFPDNPARGQSPVTALVFHDHFGGEILKTPVEDGWHFYNRVAGTVCDFAAEQFSGLPAYLNIPSSRDEALASTSPERYRALAVRVSAALRSKQGVPVVARSALSDLQEFVVDHHHMAP